MSLIEKTSRKSWGRKAAVAILATAALTFVGPISANAAERPSSPNPVIQTTAPKVVLSDVQIRDINAEVAATNGATKTFDAAAAASNGASAQGIADYAAGISSLGWSVSGAVQAPSAAAQQVVARVALACSGANGYNGYFFPWGSQFGLNSCNTTKLLAAAGLGTAGAGVVAGILAAAGATGVGLPVAGLATAIIAFGAAAIGACQGFSSNGAIWLNVGGTPTVSCWGQ